MAWFAVHSALTLALAFVTGLLVGWLVWGLRWVRAEERVIDRPEVAPADSDVPASDVFRAGWAVTHPALTAPATTPATTPANSMPEPTVPEPATPEPAAPATAAPTLAPTGFEPAATEREAFDLRRQPVDAAARNGTTVTATALLPSPSIAPDTVPMASVPSPAIEHGHPDGRDEAERARRHAAPDVAGPDVAGPDVAGPDVAGVAAADTPDSHETAPTNTDDDKPHLDEEADEEAPDPHGGEPGHHDGASESATSGSAALIGAAEPPSAQDAPRIVAAIAPEHSTTVDDETTGAAVNANPPGDHPATETTGPSESALMDDLTLIDGVTPQMAAALATEGIGSFFAVANASEDQLRRALRVNRIRSAPGIAFWATKAAELVEQAQAERSTEPSDGDGSGDEATSVERRPATEAGPESAITPKADSTPPTTPITLPPEAAAPTPSPTRRPVPGAAFRTTAHPEGPSWTSVAPAAEEDLERIHGVDAAMADALKAAGVTNYTQLAAVRDEELRQILADADLTAPPTLTTWSVQAALLLQGDSDGAATLAGGLMIGRENS